MKKFIIFLVFMFVSSTVFCADDIFIIHGKKLNLMIDKYTLLGIGIYLGFCLLTIAIIIGMYINYINNKCLIKVNSMEILKKRFALGKIPYSQFGFMKKSLGESNLDISKQTNVRPTQNGMCNLSKKS